MSEYLGLDSFWKADLSSQTLQFRKQGSHPGAVVERTTRPQFVFQGDAALYMKSPAKKYKRAAAEKWFPFITDRPLSCDVWYCLPDSNNDQAFEVAMEANDGTQRHSASIAWYKDSQYNQEQWRYWAPDNKRWQDVPGGKLTVGRGWYQWHRIQIVVDFGTRRYVSLRVDNHFFDLRETPDCGAYEMLPPTSDGANFQFAIISTAQTSAAVEAVVGSVELSYF